MRVGDVYRYVEKARADPQTERVDADQNFYWATHSPGHSKALLESGINPIGWCGSGDKKRRPAILIRSSPAKVGSTTTPWQDFFDPDHGHVRYNGDAKKAGQDPGVAPGNKALLDQYALFTSPDLDARQRACPLLFFLGVPKRGRSKGYVRFEGYGVIDRVERVTQFSRADGYAFTNYVFDCSVFSLMEESETFDWGWIVARRDRSLSDIEANQRAPKAWSRWVQHGQEALPRCRRLVSKVLVSKKAEQIPTGRSLEERCLREIYDYYSRPGTKHRFEGLAEEVVARINETPGRSYQKGWITPASSDGGADFIGRLDVGSGFGTAKLIVLGQAKCEKLDNPTSGTHIARTVARLKRGWIGAYVTTSFYSEAVQREVIEDAYPLLLVNGKKVAQMVLQAIHQGGYSSVGAYLAEIDQRYPDRLQVRRPEEILLCR